MVKFQAMHLPYFWDELGVYAPGALAMAETGPGLLPNALDTYYSHGHPLLFYFLNAQMFSWFGTDVFIGRIIPLLGAIACIIAAFFAFVDLRDKKISVALTLLLIAQPVFFAQSILLLPEIYVALFFILAITFYLQQRYYWYIIFAACALLTKETGILIPCIILFAEITNALRSKQWNGVMRRIALGMMPLIIFFIFICIQKIQKGWFFFPGHVGLMKVKLPEVILSLKAFVKFVFYDQGRWIISAVILAGGIVSLFKLRKGMRITRTQIFYAYWLAGGLLFCALNFYMSRYTLFLFVPVLYFFFLALRMLIAPVNVQLAAILICIVFGITHMRSDSFHVDTDLGYIDYLHLQTDVMQYALDKLEPEGKIMCNFPLYTAFQDKRAGFVDGTEKPFTLTTKIETADMIIIAGKGPWNTAFDVLHAQLPDTVFSNAVENFAVFRPDDMNESE